jgi:hypothetical protein
MTDRNAGKIQKGDSEDFIRKFVTKQIWERSRFLKDDEKITIAVTFL